MPYLPLAQALREPATAAAELRWTALTARQPELASAVTVQRQMVARLIALADALRRTPPARISLPPGYLAAKLGRGLPALMAERIPIPVAVLGPSLIEFSRDLAEGGAGEPAAHLGRVLAEGRIDAGSILLASLGRHQQAIRAGAVAHDLSPDLLWLVAELSASPLAHSLQSQYLTTSHDARLGAALDTWRHGYCPSCGSWPALAEAIDNRRMLRCSFCALAWDPHTGGCVYCGTSGDPYVSFTPDQSQPELRVDACGQCRAYLKTVAVTDWSPFPLLAISDLETATIDAEMMARGFTRPPLKEKF